MSITSIVKSGSARVAAGIVGTAMAFSLLATAAPAGAALTSTQVSAIISLLQSFGADAATIANVQASLTGGTPTTPTTPTSGTGACYSWTRSLTLGSTGADVQALQQFLNGNGAVVAASGAGSPGSETTYFGGLTQAALAKWQAANGVTPSVGYFGPITRAAIAAKCAPGSTPTTPVVVTGTVSVAPGVQPASSLAPASASRVPFTTFTITNGTNAVQTVSSVTVERVGLAVDSNLSGIVLVDPAGLQIGTAKTLNSNHQANLDGFTLNPGESKTLTVAGNIAATVQAGQLLSINVVSVNTTATVSGSFPITGATQTMNSTLSLGSVSTTTSSYDPGAAQSKNIGDMAVRISGLRFTASSAEDLRLYSVRWRQVGTASASDISNVVTIVDGTSYPTTVSSDGKYYTTVFPGGILIPKGNTIDVYNKADLTGTNSASRTVDLDIDKVTDVYFVGQTYGYGVAPSGTFQPWFTGYVTTINAGTVTTIGNAIEVPAQNIAVNVSNQVLGGFATDFRGEAVSVTSLPITIATTSGFTGNGAITSISIVDENGVVVAGPKDEASTCTTGCTVTFTDTITFPTGRHVYTIKGKIPSGVSDGSTVTVSTTPSSWSGVTGQVSGNTITISNGLFSMNIMTVKAASLTASLSSTPASQNIVVGAQNLTMANVQLDGSASGEDVRMSGIPLVLTVANATVSEVSNCQWYNGSTVLNTGSNVPTSLAASGSSNSFTFDNVLVIPKGTVVTISLHCDIASSVQNDDTFRWSIDSTAMTATGVTSGSSVNVSETTGNSGLFTVASGTFTLTVDSSSPSYTIAAGGTTGQTMSVMKFRASNEDVSLTKVGLTLTATTGSGNKASDLAAVYIYDGSTLVGTAVFTGTNTTATSTLSTPVTLPKGVDKTLTIKADLSAIGIGQAGTTGDLIKIDPLNAQGTGAAGTINVAATAGAAGIRLFKSFPTMAQDSLAGTGVADGKLMRFKVTASSAGPVGLTKFTFDVSTTTLTISNIGLYAYTDSSYSTPVNDSVAIGGTSSGGQIDTTLATSTSLCTAAYDTAAGSQCDSTSSVQTYQFRTATNAVQVPAGGTRYFELRGSVTGSTTGASAVVTLKADTATATGTVATLTSSYNFIWSPNSTTTTVVAGQDDWTTGYGITGFSASGLVQARSN